MTKHLLLTRDENGDWYKRAQSFLAENGVKPLRMELTDEPRSNNAFLSALSLLATNTGEPVTVDEFASIVVLTADDQMLGPDEAVDLLACECKCGATLSCGGGGGGH